MDEEVGMKRRTSGRKGERSGRATTSWLQSGMYDGRSDETTSSFDGAAVFRLLDHGGSPREFMETHHSPSSRQTHTETHIVGA